MLVNPAPHAVFGIHVQDIIVHEPGKIGPVKDFSCTGTHLFWMAGELTEKYLEKWSDSLPTVDAVLSVFSHVRDIPYTAIPGMSDPVAGPELLLSFGRGSCTPKHNLLGQMLEMLGIPVRFASFRFCWDGARIPFPVQLKKQAGSLPIVYHMAIRAFLNGRWTLLDATWDSLLQEAGFPVNNPWDGISDCLLAIVPLPFEDGSTENLHGSMQEREMFYQVRASGYQVEEVLALNIFYQDLNAWLETIREPRKYPLFSHSEDNRL